LALSWDPTGDSFDKAFSCAKSGKVLGIIFNTENLSWHRLDEKATKYQNLVHSFLNKSNANLNEIQNLMGCLNHVAQMCPFLLCFKFNLNTILAKLSISDSDTELLNNHAKKELAM
jgi:hypothetical protein